jgi:hypothetical protein
MVGVFGLVILALGPVPAMPAVITPVASAGPVNTAMQASAASEARGANKVCVTPAAPAKLAMQASAIPDPRPLEFRVCALVQARAAAWPAILADAVIDPDRLSFRRKTFLEPSDGIPVRAPEVRRALATALKGLKPGERKRTRAVLDAIGSGVASGITEEAALASPVAWRTAAQVFKDGRGNPFELVRALVALARAAGIPARPSFNGVPVVLVYVMSSAPGRTGTWTVWDPLHPSGSFGRLPVLWIPLRSGDVLPVTVKPRETACVPRIAGRRILAQAEAVRVYEFVKANGTFPVAEAGDLDVSAPEWWEVWTIGAGLDPGPGETVVTVPLPFVPEAGYGAREHAVWSSDPSRVKPDLQPHAQTDQYLGGLLLTVRVVISPAVAHPLAPAASEARRSPAEAAPLPMPVP